MTQLMVWSCEQNASGRTAQKANARRPVGRPRNRWINYVENLGRNRLKLHRSEKMDVMEDCEMGLFNLELLPPQLSRKSG